MDKNQLLIELSNAKDSYVIGLAGMGLLKNPAVIPLLQQMKCTVSDWVIPFAQVAESMAKPDRKEADLRNFARFILRAMYKDSYEALQDYCKKTGQHSKRVCQPWHQFSRLIRNCLAHDYHFCFTSHDKKKLPVSWGGMTIDAAMEGSELSFEFFPPGKALDLWNAFYTFARDELE